MAGFRSASSSEPAIEMAGFASRRYQRTVSRLIPNSLAIRRCDHPRSARSSSTSRYDSEKRKYQPTASRIISGSNWRHLNRPATEGSRTISAQLIKALLQSCNTSFREFYIANLLPGLYEANWEKA